MSTTGQKRKLKDTDIPITDNDAPLIKQQKLTPNDTSQEATPNDPNPSIKAESSESKDDTQNTDKMEQDYDNNNNTLDTETFSKLQSQLEYYFGDSNLPFDTHILETSKSNNGYYPINNLLNFSKIQELKEVSISNIISAILSSTKLELNDSQTGVQRHSNLHKLPTKEEIYSRTIFAKGFHPRTTLNELINFWQLQTENKNNILSVRTIKETISVGICGENNEKKIIKKFLGNCFIECNNINLANEFSKMTFKYNNKIIRCGMYNMYFNNNIKWKIKKKILEFKSNKIILIRNIPNYSTKNDIKNWICNGLYANINKKNSKNKCEFVLKNMNNSFAYVRFNNQCDINECIQLIKQKPLMGIYPSINILNDDNAKKIWENVAQINQNKNKNVEIIIENENNKNGNNNNNEDVDIVGIKEENNNDNTKKHKLDDVESTQPAKKQKTC